MSEVRLIDANALLSKMVNEPVKAVDGVDFDTEWFTRIADTAVQFTDMVEDAPTVDAVPVEWINAKIESLKSKDNVFASLTAGMIEAMLNDYCADGERRTE